MSIEFSNTRSIFVQIADGICEKITNGTFPPGSKLPSVRELAAEKGVNPNTVMRTFNELQIRNIIENKRGIGFFVATDAYDKIIAWKRDDFFSTVVPDFLRQMTIIGVSMNELVDYISKNKTEKQ